jgi:hypothetical protein
MNQKINGPYFVIDSKIVLLSKYLDANSTNYSDNIPKTQEFINKYLDNEHELVIPCNSLLLNCRCPVVVVDMSDESPPQVVQELCEFTNDIYCQLVTPVNSQKRRRKSKHS